ncbi:MAG: hypothetical protein J6C97_00515 [Clostridia bacterium]|nr:hypothetical protein [Clostridia bacterium]
MDINKKELLLATSYMLNEKLTLLLDMLNNPVAVRSLSLLSEPNAEIEFVLPDSYSLRVSEILKDDEDNLVKFIDKEGNFYNISELWDLNNKSEKVVDGLYLKGRNVYNFCKDKLEWYKVENQGSFPELIRSYFLNVDKFINVFRNLFNFNMFSKSAYKEDEYYYKIPTINGMEGVGVIFFVGYKNNYINRISCFFYNQSEKNSIHIEFISKIMIPSVQQLENLIKNNV